MHAYLSKIGKMAAISKYIVAQPNRVIVKNIGLATLKTFTLRCWNM